MKRSDKIQQHHSRAWQRWGFCLLALVALLTCLQGLGLSAQEIPPTARVLKDQQVLILTSYGYGRPGVDLLLKGFLSALAQNGMGVEQVFTEHLDLERAKDSAFRRSLAEALRQKYARKSIQVIYILEQPALDFFLHDLAGMASGAPVIVARAKVPSLPGTSGQPFISQLLAYDVAGTLHRAMELFPKTREILFIAGSTDSDRAVAAQAGEAAEQLKKKVQHENTCGLTLDDIQARITQPVADRIILVLPFNRDGQGRTTAQMEIAFTMAAMAKAPVFTLWDSVVGRGAVGGSVTNFSDIGQQAGQYAIELMTGQKVPAEPVTLLSSPSAAKFDWAQIERWGGETSTLPPDSVFINRPQTLWMQHRRTVLVTLFVLLSQALLIAGLFIQRSLRRKAQTALQESAENLSITLHSIGDAVIATDGAGLITRMNPTAERLTAWPSADALGRPLTEVFRIVNAHTRLPSVDPVQAVLARGEVVGLANHTVLLARNGQEYQIADSAAPIREAAGRIVGVVLVFSDVTEKYQAEAALHEGEEQFRSYVDNAPFGIFVCDEGGRYQSVNPAAALLTGYSREELLTFGIPDLLPPESLEISTGMFNHLVQTGHAKGEMAFRRKNGQVGVWTLEAVRLSATRFMAMVVDVSDRVRIGKEAQQKERYQRALLDNFPFAVWLKDTESRFLSVNAGFAEVFGMNDPEEAVGKSDFDIAPLEMAEAYQAVDRMVMALHQNNVTEEEILTDGVRKWFETYKAPVIDDQGMLLGTVGFARDITQQKEAEEVKAKLQAQLQQSQKMESLGILASGVAHDMNNVLGAILGLASAHLGTMPCGTPLHQALGTICKAAERGGKMVKSLLTFARQSPVENDKLDMNAILKEQVSLLERTTLVKVRLHLDLEAELRPIQGDASALTHAFMNLCVNAVDAMPEDGVLTLHTRNIDTDWIEIVVEDNGMGMTKEVLEKALDPFFTTKGTGKGTGLGLSMVFSTVKAHRGQMAIESEPDQGTRVRLRFPACEKHAQVAVAAASDETLAPHGNLKVMLVDDDDLIQSSVQAILEFLGHTAVTTAQSGEEALAMLEAGYEPNLVILDMNMPGLGGSGTLPRLRGLRPLLPVLLSTGRADQNALALASAHPGVTLLSKPFGLKELQKHLENIGLG